MRKSLSLVLGILALGAAVIAQTHDNALEKKASDEITLSADTKVGTQVLKAGLYQVACDTKTVTFSLIETRNFYTTVTKVLQVPCEGKHLADKSAHTQVVMPVKNGTLVLEKITLRGGNVEHVLPGQF